jgi:hypothetical protein
MAGRFAFHSDLAVFVATLVLGGLTMQSSPRPGAFTALAPIRRRRPFFTPERPRTAFEE